MQVRHQCSTPSTWSCSLGATGCRSGTKYFECAIIVVFNERAHFVPERLLVMMCTIIVICGHTFSVCLCVSLCVSFVYSLVFSLFFFVSIYLSYLSVYLSMCRSFYQLIFLYMSVCLSLCMYVCLSIYPCVDLLSIDLSIYVCLSISLYVCLSIYLLNSLCTRASSEICSQ